MAAPVRPWRAGRIFIVGQSGETTGASRARVEAENTSGLLGLYTRFLQCFVSANATRRNVIAAGGNGSIGSTMIPQNAGCTMAIHADCTTPEINEIYNLLIYMDF
ncbi:MULTISPECIES: hypothetical protein [Pseudomonas]|uniref:hypothetical protein n=1 Tax=Pseudomonas TaxID=286 RepID=UPI00146E40E7|nr:hypothetical protein [Pseudomonas fluorescens]